MPEKTKAERRWESWYEAYNKVVEPFPEPVDVPCPEGDGGHIRLTYYARPGSPAGSVTAWCDRCYHGIWLDRVGIPAGAEVYSFEDGPTDRPDIELIPDALYTPDDYPSP
ncbi:hypothetical protein [Paractinoplanes toevensis]|uniref:Uncharacterized protein n=1 Tax=Paractinoplanes toevensis TaxID=571911 RepID=A0A919T692_9ACTN|nr:hypothetical protein [Actinoplanes toevensis]GIM89933.1 hypothetical protein Ato02nite_017260 [Actinoplanes toevensis]